MKYASLSLKICAGCQHLIALLSLVLAFTLDGEMLVVWLGLGVISALMGFGIRKVRQALEAGKYWGWVGSVVVCGLFTMSGLFPVGIMGLVGLLKKETRQAFADIDARDTDTQRNLEGSVLV